MDFLFNVLIWVGVVIFAIFIIGFMAAAKLNKRQDEKNDQLVCQACYRSCNANGRKAIFVLISLKQQGE